MARMKGRIKLRHETRPDGSDVVFYEGPINEDLGVELERLVASLGPRVVIDFGGVESVNSSGIRAWVTLLRSLRHKVVAFERVTPTVVYQINMIPSFSHGVEVRSVYAPFVCGGCRKASSKLLLAAEFPRPGG